LPHVEFAYNLTFHSTTSYSPFEIVYCFNPLTPLDILPLPTNEFANLDGTKKADTIRELHAKVRANIEKKNKQYAKQANKGRVKVTFEPGLGLGAYEEGTFSESKKIQIEPKRRWTISSSREDQ